MLDAVETGRDQAGDGEVGVDVAPGEAVLEAHGAAVADHAQGAGAVVEAPGDGGRGEGSRAETLVRVDVGGVEKGEVAQCGELTGQEVAHHG